MDNAQLGEYFAVKTYRELAQRVAVDAQSSFCAGTYLDGAWTYTDSACQDVIRYTAANEPSAYITVHVEPTQELRANVSIAVNQNGE